MALEIEISELAVGYKDSVDIKYPFIDLIVINLTKK